MMWIAAKKQHQRYQRIYSGGAFTSVSDLMEYVEICSIHDADIKFNELYIYKYSSSASSRIGSASGCTVPAGETVVLWCYREAYLTDADSYHAPTPFRNAYGMTFSDKVYPFKDQNGLTNDNRAIELFRLNDDGSLGEPVSSYCYLGDSDCADGLSAQLKINPEGPAMLLQSGNVASTVGSVDPAVQ